MTYPTIHINGTNPKTLLEELCSAYNAVQNALEVVAATAPNPRDYYIHKQPDAFRTADAEHRARLTALQKVAAELADLAEYVVKEAEKKGFVL